jgi:uncharacterized protein YbjT (DUF2867 family)
MTQELTVVVTGATGKQGGAVARGLLKQGHKVRAVTRDPNSSQAKSLAELADLVARGELEVPIAAVFPLDDVRNAFRQVELRHTRGKVVLRL